MVLRGLVVGLCSEVQTYSACSNCKKKNNEALFAKPCRHCGCGSTVRRYRVQVRVVDGTQALRRVTVFGETADVLFGASVENLYSAVTDSIERGVLEGTAEDAITTLCKECFVGQCLDFHLKKDHEESLRKADGQDLSYVAIKVEVSDANSYQSVYENIEMMTGNEGKIRAARDEPFKTPRQTASSRYKNPVPNNENQSPNAAWKRLQWRTPKHAATPFQGKLSPRTPASTLRHGAVAVAPLMELTSPSSTSVRVEDATPTRISSLFQDKGFSDSFFSPTFEKTPSQRRR